MHKFKLGLLLHQKITMIKFYFLHLHQFMFFWIFFFLIRPVNCDALGYAISVILCLMPDACDRAPTTAQVAKSILALPDSNRKCCPRKSLMCEEHFNMGKPLVRKCSFSSTSLWVNITYPPFSFCLVSYQTASRVIKNITKSATCFVIKSWSCWRTGRAEAGSLLFVTRLSAENLKIWFYRE